MLLKDNASFNEKFRIQAEEKSKLTEEKRLLTEETRNHRLWTTNEKYRKENRVFYDRIKELIAEKEIDFLK